ncbi:phospholipase D3 [Denticeps clupeoides]|uniref:PLD phosphodiesterase domain-containing protein n=1 Tax=Denticeps clupeoides TaxID=299321 RepID=A0AAY4D3C3_9TELE|nr:phospholipase D3-like [Denticeps clupeoides]
MDPEETPHEPLEDQEDKKNEEEEETRKAAKQQTSRIPTFQSSVGRKRLGHSDLPASSQLKLEAPNPLQPKEKGDASRTKAPGCRETALPLPTVRLPTSISNTADARDRPVAPGAIKGRSPSPDHRRFVGKTSEMHLQDDPIQSSSDGGPHLAPAGHAEERMETSSSEEDRFPQNMDACVLEEDLEDTLHLSSSETPSDDHSYEEVVKLEEKTDITKDGEKRFFSQVENSETLSDQADSGQEAARGSAECEEDLLTDLKDVCGKFSQAVEKTDGSSRPVPERQHSCSATKTPGRTCTVFLLPTFLLLLGGFGQHIWQYGIPASISHVMVQLELHWLEGFWMPQETCSADCRLTWLESLPEGMEFPAGSPHLPAVSQAWLSLLSGANRSVEIAAFYFTLTDSELGLQERSADQGKQVLEKLKHLGSQGVKLHIAVNSPQTYDSDTEKLQKTGAEVRTVDMQSATGGVLHTKLWVVDRKHLYIGSANMDWRSLTQVKELGVSLENCSCLAQDASRIFGIYWDIGARKNGSLPHFWPGRLSAVSSSKHPLVVKLNGVPARVYLSSAPPSLSARGRSDDLTTILSVIADARLYVHVSVMDFLPFSQFTTPERYWPPIDVALREAACAQGVEVRLLVSCWNDSPGSMFVFLQSLQVLSQPPLQCKISIKVFEVPSTGAQKQIPFARVNHAKYMVTDRVVYIGTSNWSENYFTKTAGVSLVVNQTGFEVVKGQKTAQSQLQEIFQRDWDSQFAHSLSADHAGRCRKHRQTF